MSKLQTRQKNIPVSFNKSELDLLDEFDDYCDENFMTRSSVIKRLMRKELKEKLIAI